MFNMERFRKKINNRIKKVKKSNVPKFARKLFKYNIIRCHGLLANTIINEKIASSSNACVYAASMSIIDSKFPEISKL